MNDNIDKLQKLIDRCDKCDLAECINCEICWTEVQAIKGLIERNKELEESRKNGTLSDGFHTYNDLYYQRCILFATICNINKEFSWKSKKHSDGKKCFDSDDWFIVGIDTPEGSYTYHYEMKYWNLFNVQELEKGKEWDGHTEKDVTRLFSLKSNSIRKDKIKEKIKWYEEACEHLSSNGIDLDRYDQYQGAIQVLQELLEE